MKEEQNFISDEDGRLLVTTARKTVSEFLKNNVKINDLEFKSKFNFESGVFVTINKQNNLRGCIGYPLPIKKLAEGLVDASISVATQDPRFLPIEENELDQIVFEVTVLTPPEEIKVDSPSEYLSKIKIGQDGLIVEGVGGSGLLLPQVPGEYGWNEEEFLEHTCEKAGLDRNAWRKNSTKVSKFQGTIFKESTPSGEIIREK